MIAGYGDEVAADLQRISKLDEVIWTVVIWIPALLTPSCGGCGRSWEILVNPVTIAWRRCPSTRTLFSLGATSDNATPVNSILQAKLCYLRQNSSSLRKISTIQRFPNLHRPTIFENKSTCNHPLWQKQNNSYDPSQISMASFKKVFLTI